MPELKWLETYSGETIEELLALATTHRCDSIVLAAEQAILELAGRIGMHRLTESEAVVLAVEALEREVNNGGYHQFFLNTPEFTPFIVEALVRIECHKTAAISARAISLLSLSGPASETTVTQALDADPEGRLIDVLYEQCDGPYYITAEPIADLLLDYVRTNRDSIRIGVANAS
jgi:hypothetical protein